MAGFYDNFNKQSTPEGHITVYCVSVRNGVCTTLKGVYREDPENQKLLRVHRAVGAWPQVLVQTDEGLVCNPRRQSKEYALDEDTARRVLRARMMRKIEDTKAKLEILQANYTALVEG